MAAVSLNYSTGQADILRRQKLAELLDQQASEAIPIQS